MYYKKPEKRPLLQALYTQLPGQKIEKIRGEKKMSTGMELKNNDGIRIKYDSELGYVILSRKGSQDTRYTAEKKQCRTCKHLRKAVTVTENLFETNPVSLPVPLGVCTMGIMWKVVHCKQSPDLLNCNRLSMGLKDTFNDRGM